MTGMSTLDMREFSIFGQSFEIHEDLFKHGDNDWGQQFVADVGLFRFKATTKGDLVAIQVYFNRDLISKLDPGYLYPDESIHCAKIIARMTLSDTMAVLGTERKYEEKR